MNHWARKFHILKHIRFAFSLTSAESEFCLKDKCLDFHSNQQIHLLLVMTHWPKDVRFSFSSAIRTQTHWPKHLRLAQFPVQFTQILSEHLIRWWNLGQAIKDCYKIATWLLTPDFVIKQSRIVTRLLLDCLPLILSSSNQGLLQDCNNSQIRFHLCPKMDAWIIPCKTRKSCYFKANLGFGLGNPKLTHFGFSTTKGK
jgi:hypothetical protein